MTSPLRVGLVGAGPWAEKAYAPMLAAGPETSLAAVWSRRPDAAHALAVAHGSVAVASLAELLERCEAVAFAVPPDVQAELAIVAARAGRHLLLDKPLALTLADAERVAAAVAEAGVVSQLMLTHRFRPATQAFLARAAAVEAIGARLAFLTGAFLRGPYANAWRRQHGALHDLGPHALDLVEAAVGPIASVRGTGDPRTYVVVTCVHTGGAVSDIALSGAMDLPRSVLQLDVHHRGGTIAFDAVAAAHEEPWSAVRREFAAAVRAGVSPALDVRRGLQLQRWISAAAAGS